MARYSFLQRLFDRRARLKGYQVIRSEFEHLSEADLADIGAKRYQLGHAARVKAFK
jgi:uncharacterized protein YjiS (DUF1127 family)